MSTLQERAEQAVDVEQTLKDERHSALSDLQEQVRRRRLQFIPPTTCLAMQTPCDH